jgi:hypothetical protein
MSYLEREKKVRITSKDSYPVGSLWIIDAAHMPFGCSVSLSTWSYLYAKSIPNSLVGLA